MRRRWRGWRRSIRRLAGQIHAGDGPKPLTCSGLVPAGPPAGREPSRHPSDSVRVCPGELFYVRITGLTEAVSRALLAGLVERPPARWALHGRAFQPVEAVCDAARHAWSGTASYERLVVAALQAAGPLPRAVTLEFASPIAFRSLDMQVPLPLPGLVFGSLAERWNAFSPVALDPGLRRLAEERVAISRYRLESRPVPQKNGAVRIGGVGQVTYTLLDDNPYALAALNILADFALYSGAGVQTATGMGQCRRVG